MENVELLMTAMENTERATRELGNILETGQVHPVAAGEFERVRHLLTAAGCAVQELELRAKGFATPKAGNG